MTLNEGANTGRPMPYVTPLVARLAAEHGVDLRDVQGTGVAGRISRDDVLRAASASQFAAGLRPGAAAAGRGRFALNPLVDRARAEMRAAGRPAPGGATPTLFPNGQDLPAFTASGIDPSALLDVPWQARHALAAAPTAAQAYAIVEQCSGPEAEEVAARAYGLHDGNADYEYRVQQWRLGSMSDQELFDSLENGARDELNRRENERPLNLAHTVPPSPQPVARVEPKIPDDVPDVPAGATFFSNGRTAGQWSDAGRYR